MSHRSRSVVLAIAGLHQLRSDRSRRLRQRRARGRRGLRLQRSRAASVRGDVHDEQPSARPPTTLRRRRPLSRARRRARASPSSAPACFESTNTAITDVDHDRHRRRGRRCRRPRSSCATASPPVRSRRSTRSSRRRRPGPPAFGDLDSDGSLDVTITTPDGLVSYSSPYGTLSPLAVHSSILGSRTTRRSIIRMLFGVSPVDARRVRRRHSGHLLLLVVDFGNTANPRRCGAVRREPARAPTSRPSMLDVYQVNRDGEYPTDIVVSMAFGTGANAQAVRHDAIHKDNVLATADR